ncbi:hypothetical protein OG979_20690 [Actinomadura citrea]|nr:hypothetical protein [Actinomadura citrea]
MRADQAAERLPANGEKETNAERLRRVTGSGASILQGLRQETVSGLGLMAKSAAQRREADLAAGAFEQSAAQMAFQGGDGPAHLRLGEMEPVGGMAEMQLLGQRQEHFYLPQVRQSMPPGRVGHDPCGDDIDRCIYRC